MGNTGNEPIAAAANRRPNKATALAFWATAAAESGALKSTAAAVREYDSLLYSSIYSRKREAIIFDGQGVAVQ